MADLLFTPNEKQAQAIKLAKEWYINQEKRPFIITGCAGSGKSTLIKFLINELGIPIEKTTYLTFTGKAASVLIMKGHQATTIHRFIYNPEADEKDPTKINFKLKDLEQIDKNIELVIVDEFYMVSNDLMKDLMSFNLRIILLGDPNQLPPIGDKNMYADMSDVYLDQPMRQELESPILYIANLARTHKRIPYGDYGDGVKVIRRNQIREEYFMKDQIIAGFNKTVKNLNRYYRKKFLHAESLMPMKGEKLMCLKNNWRMFCTEGNLDINLVNGMTGYLASDITEESTIKTIACTKANFQPDFFEVSMFPDILIDLLYFQYEYKDENEFWENREKYEDIIRNRKIFEKTSFSTIEKFMYGYAATCYKCQGSQFGSVFFIQESFRDKWYQHLYTGITRAEKELILVL